MVYFLNNFLFFYSGTEVSLEPLSSCQVSFYSCFVFIDLGLRSLYFMDFRSFFFFYGVSGSYVVSTQRNEVSLWRPSVHDGAPGRPRDLGVDTGTCQPTELLLWFFRFEVSRGVSRGQGLSESRTSTLL